MKPLALIVLLAAGCATMPPTGTAASGGPLGVQGYPTNWYGLQDHHPIDDEDLFHIAGDEEAARDVHAYREGGVLMNAAGLLLSTTGVAAITAAIATGVQGNTSASRGFFLSAPVFILAGGVLSWSGMRRVSPGVHPVGYGRAQAAVDGYDARLAAQLASAPKQVEATEPRTTVPR